MSSSGSVTHWINLLKVGDRVAAQPLWERYFPRLVVRARARLQGLPRRAADEEDVALSAFDSFCRRAEQGRFPKLDDRDDLWQVLMMLAARKAVDLIRHERRQMRAGLGEEALGALEDETGALAQVVGDEPTPEIIAQVAEECERLLGCLGDDGLRDVAVWKMEGYSNAEIAECLGVSERSVERKLRSIRGLWEQEKETDER